MGKKVKDDKSQLNDFISELDVSTFKNFMDHSTQGLGLADLQGRVVYINDRLREIVGLDPSENVIEDEFLHYYPSVQREILQKEAIPEILKKGFWSGELGFEMPDGGFRHTQEDYFLINDKNGNPQYIATVISDITEKKLAEKALRKSEEKFIKAFQSSPDAIGISRLSDGRYIEVNDGFTELFGFKRKDVIGKLSSEIDIYNDMKDRDVLKRKLQKDGIVKHHLIILKTKNGKKASCDFSAQIIEINGEHCLQAVVRELTDEGLKNTIHQLEERVKEQTCLYNVMNSIHLRTSLEDLFGDVVELIPPGWQYSDMTSCKITFGKSVYKSKNFRASKWKLARELKVNGQNKGSIEVFYQKKMPDMDFGPFLKEEEMLLDSIAKSLGEAIESYDSKEILEKNWDMMKTIFQNFSEIIYITDPHTYEVLLVNKKFEDMLGYDPVGMKCYKAFQGFDKPCEFCTNKIILKTKKAHHWEYHNELLDKDYFITDQLIDWIDGKKARFELATDITDRKKAEKGLIEEKNFSDAVINSLPGVFYMFDSKGKFVRWNENFRKVTGFSEKEMAKMGPRDFFTGEDRKHIEEHVGKVFVNGKAEAEACFTTKKGKKIPYYFQAEDIVIDGEHYLVGTGWDLSELKKTRSELYIKNIVFESSCAANSVSDEKGIITFCNPKFLELWGYKSKDEVVGNSIANFLKYKQEGAKIIGGLMENDVWEGEYAGLKKDGSTFNAYGLATTVKNDRGELIGFQSAVLDITQRKNAEEKEKQLTHELSRAIKELEQIIYVTSHDLRSPLVNVQGFTNEMNYSVGDLKELMKDERIPGDIRKKACDIIVGDILDSQKYIHASIDKMDRLLKGLLIISRLGRSVMKTEDIKMNNLVQDALASHEFELKQNKIDVEIGELPDCSADPDQINQVFSNLIGNAVKYSDPEKKGKITISGEEIENKVQYSVEDNGYGIEEDHQEKIFELFHRLRPQDTEGEGLGLSIVARIIEKHGGKIWVESKPGVGSKFYITLPKN